MKVLTEPDQWSSSELSGCLLIDTRDAVIRDSAARWMNMPAQQLAAALEDTRPARSVVGGVEQVVVYPHPDAPSPVRLFVRSNAVLVIAPRDVIDILLDIVEAAPADAVATTAAVLLAFARTWEDAVDDISDAVQRLECQAVGLSGSSWRTETSALRSRLAVTGRRAVRHQRLLAAGIGEDFGHELPADVERVFDAAGDHFNAAADFARQLCSVLGDALDRRAATVSERLTLVATIFLPLTFATGFFGMNFGWLTDHIGSFSSFLVLGIGGPVVSVFLGVRGLRRISG